MRWRCGNNNGGSDLQKPQDPPPPFAFSHPSLPRFFPRFILDVLPGSFLHTVSRTTTPLFVYLHLIRFATSHAIPIPNGRPSPMLPLPGTISYSTFNDLLQSSSPSPFHLSHQSHELFPLSFLIYCSPFRLTLRCHLDPQSTLALPDYFFSLNVCFHHCTVTPPSCSSTLSVDEFSR